MEMEDGAGASFLRSELARGSAIALVSDSLLPETVYLVLSHSGHTDPSKTVHKCISWTGDFCHTLVTLVTLDSVFVL